MTKELETIEQKHKNENKRRIAEAKSRNSEAVNKAIDSYKEEMKTLLEENVFLTKEKFKTLEKDIEVMASEMFANSCSSGNREFKKPYERDFKEKLKDSRDDFKRQNANNLSEIIRKTEYNLRASVEEYNNRMNDNFETFTSEEDLMERHEEVMQNVLDFFKDICDYNEPQFLDKYMEELTKDLNKSSIELKTKFSEKVKGLHSSFKTAVIESKDFYIKV